MKLKINKEDVTEGIQKAAGIIPQKTGAAFLRTIWLQTNQNNLKIMSTDSKLEFLGNYPAETQQEGLIGVQGKNFHELFRKLPPGEIELTADEETSTLYIKQGPRKYKLPTIDSSWFQNFSPFSEENATNWSGNFVRTLIDRISFCMEDDSSDYTHYMKLAPVDEEGNIEVCGLNNSQFALQKFNHQDISKLLEPEGIIIAKPYLLELKKWLRNEDIYFALNEKRIFFSTHNKNEIFSLPVNYEKFPNYQAFLSHFEDQTSKMRIHKDELIESLERISIFNTETQRCTYLVFNDNELVLYSQGQDTGEANETLPIEFQGDIEKIIYPTRNIMEVLNHFNSEQLTFEFTNSNGPCKITGDQEGDSNYLVIIMPVEIEEETYYSEEVVD